MSYTSSINELKSASVSYRTLLRGIISAFVTLRLTMAMRILWTQVMKILFNISNRGKILSDARVKALQRGQRVMDY